MTPEEINLQILRHEEEIKRLQLLANQQEQERAKRIIRQGRIGKWVGRIHCGDAISKMMEIPSESIDLIVTSPPYNIGGIKAGERWKSARQKSGYDSYSDNLPREEYIKWQRNCLHEMMRLIPENGAIFYNTKWKIYEGSLDMRQEIVEGFPVRQVIIWNRGSGMNFSSVFFVPTYEVIYLIAKPQFRLIKGATGKGDVWDFKFINTRHDKSFHPCPFPLELPKRCIESTSASVILDPFMGSGQTAIAAEKLNRQWIGIDNSELYCELGQKAIKKARTITEG